MAEAGEKPRRVIPAWQAVDVMTDAIIGRRWPSYDPRDGGTEEVYLLAKSGDYDVVHDDMGDALYALAEKFGVEIDWDAERPEAAPSGADEQPDDGPIGPN